MIRRKFLMVKRIVRRKGLERRGLGISDIEACYRGRVVGLVR